MDTVGQTCRLKSDNSRAGFHHRRNIIVCVIAGEARAIAKTGIFPLQQPLSSHLLSSSERCVLLLISSTCQKLGEQLRGRTAALLIPDT